MRAHPLDPPSLGPIVYLKADENTDYDDQYFENDGEPALFTYGVRQPSENHLPLPADGAYLIVFGLKIEYRC